MAETVTTAAAGTHERGVLHPAIKAKLHLLDGIGSWEELADPEKGARMQEFDSWPGAAAAPEVDVRDDSAPRPARAGAGAHLHAAGRRPTAPRWSGCTAARSSAATSTCARPTASRARSAPGPAPSSSASTTGSATAASPTRCRTTTSSPPSAGCATTRRPWAWTPRISVGGASAGANLAAGATLRLRDDDDWQPAALVLAYPVAHPSLPPARRP